MPDKKISELVNLGAAPASDDDLVIVDTSAGATKKVTIADLNKHPDNVKATFGDSEDLQIYHDGSHSYVQDAGTGNLILKSSHLNLRDANNDLYLEALQDGAVTIRYDNAIKLATTSIGIDVTGNTLSDSLTANGSLSGLNAGSVMLDYNGSSVSRLLAVGADATTTGTLKVVSTASDGGPYIEALTVNSTGIDVTGTVTADGLTVDGTDAGTGGVFVESNTVGVGARLDTFDGTLTNTDVVLNAGLLDSDNSLILRMDSNGNGSGDFYVTEGTTDSTRIKVTNNGDISFYEDTGTTAKFFWDASAESLGIGTTSPQAKLDVSNNGASQIAITNSSGTTKNTQLLFKDNVGVKWRVGMDVATNNNTNIFQIYNGVTATASMSINDSGNVGIGTTSPKTQINVASATGSILTLESTDTTLSTNDVVGQINFYANDSSTNSTGNKAFIKAYSETNGGNKVALDFATSGSNSATGITAMTIKSDGNVGIGTTSPSNLLHVSKSVTGQLENITRLQGLYGVTNRSHGIGFSINNNDVSAGVYITDGGGAGSNLIFTTATSYATPTNTERMRIDSSGRVGIGTTSPFAELHVYNGSANADIRAQGGGASDYISLFHGASTSGLWSVASTTPMIFATNNTERARIDSSGNLLIGKSAVGLGTAGAQFGADGFAGFTRSAQEPMRLTRLSTDGTILDFWKDGATVGSIGANSGTVYLSGASNGIKCTTNALIAAGASGGNRDNLDDLGSSSARWKNLYLSGGVYLGGTGAANLLDDYEEGTWTPVIADAASAGNTSPTSASSATYTKIGNLVTVQMNIQNIDTTGMTGANDMFITGLPFAVKSISGTSYFTGSLIAAGLTFTGNISVFAEDNTSHLHIAETTSASAADIVIVSEISSGSTDLWFSITYMAA